MNAILDHPANVGVVRSLCRKKAGRVSVVGLDAFTEPSDAYIWCGSHPEIVERVWDQLGRGLPSDCRRVLCGTPVLVDADTGVVLATAYGTRYCVRVPMDALPAALAVGCETSQRFVGGTIIDISREFGPDWVFGRWAEDESAWIRSAATAFGSTRPTPSPGA